MLYGIPVGISKMIKCALLASINTYINMYIFTVFGYDTKQSHMST